MQPLDARLVDAARRGNVVILAGAGVSADKPANLPGWKPLNRAIARALRTRLEAGIERKGWLTAVEESLDHGRESNRFPPDYQAQILEEVAGERYFRALQSLDVGRDAVNRSHDGIAAIAAAGALRAVITTNFDRLIEEALDARGVRYTVAFDDGGYDAITPAIRSGARDPLPVIKVHGCVTSHTSMIDTLKQRLRGRSQAVNGAVEPLQSAYWIYAGFSAEDLESNPEYLGLSAAARAAIGATYIAYPKSPDLRPGAQVLREALQDRWQKVDRYIPEFLGELCSSIGANAPRPISEETAVGPQLVEQRLAQWAGSLSTSAAGLCLSAMFEAFGDAEPAVRILDRLVRKEVYDERGTDDFRSLQLSYGRLGAVWGRFFAVPDLNGAQSNASVESVQSLLRILDSSAGFAARGWLATLYLWLDNGQAATQIAGATMLGVLENRWPGPSPRSDEETVDAWISAAQVMFVNADAQTLTALEGTSRAALNLARRAGDAIRVARIHAMTMLALAEACQDVGAYDDRYAGDFKQANRVNDGFALGMRQLALGRWQAKRCATGGDVEQCAIKATEHLCLAIEAIRQHSMDAWGAYACLVLARCGMYRRDLAQAQQWLNTAADYTGRFPAWRSHLLETLAAVKESFGDHTAPEAYRMSIEAAAESGLLHRAEFLSGAVNGTA
ncbi:MAG: hypothetical protein GIKADHBN_02829 [Phycisphaerales bacterium]|nr:hypothetical protein [Phycisphaerales bacterium]